MKPTYTILEEISSKDFLKKAWRLLNKSNKRSRGNTNITIKDFEDRLDTYISDLSQSLLDNTFQFSPVRGTTIKKKALTPVNSDTKQHSSDDELANRRPLRIPEIKDRIVHKALAIKIEELVSETFKLNNECSFAYQKEKSIEDAILQMGLYCRQGYKIILEADIIKFFDNVNSSALIEKVKKALPDPSINSLLDGAVNQELGNIDELKSKKLYELYFKDSEAGIPQGNALSPLLANIYLCEFDHRIINEGLKMVRYADDFIIMCRSKEEAKFAYDVACEELQGKLGLSLHPLQDAPDEIHTKISKIVDPRQHEFSFLSIRFDGEKFWVVKDKIKSLTDKLKCLSAKEQLHLLYPKEEIGLFQALTKIKNLLDGWIAAYCFVDCDRQILELDKCVNIQLVKLFNSFNFQLKTSALEQVSLKGHRRQVWALTEYQRNLSGIPACHKILTRARKGMLTLNERISLKLQPNAALIKETVSEEPLPVSATTSS